jgi:hypothetical protein
VPYGQHFDQVTGKAGIVRTMIPEAENYRFIAGVNILSIQSAMKGARDAIVGEFRLKHCGNSPFYRYVFSIAAHAC